MTDVRDLNTDTNDRGTVVGGIPPSASVLDSALALEDAVEDESLASRSETRVLLFAGVMTGDSPLKVGILLALIGAGELSFNSSVATAMIY